MEFFAFMSEWGVEIRKQRNLYEGKFNFKKVLNQEKDIEEKYDEILLYLNKIVQLLKSDNSKELTTKYQEVFL